ncbi:MAG: 3-deoxy-D-manno-octulosonic acid transferase [Candidatus Anammoximicrobium sp.]|nr:3-deoxy-D-manno-octulosonic acid transferase [Candidatus Anammoximicrobium sp.]
MPYLLNLAYLLLLVVCLPWLLGTALRKGKYREGFGAKLLGRVPIRQGAERCVWLHAVSVGEVNLLGPLLVRLEQQHPDWVHVISTTTKTGFELAKKKYAPRTVFYCPLDFSWAVRTAMKRIRPNLLVLAELELWPNLIWAAKRHGAKVAVVNGRLSDRSFRGYRRVRPFVARLLQSLDAIAAQNDEYAARFCQLGARPEIVQRTGSIKFDGAQTDRDNSKTRQLAEAAGIEPDDIVFLAGSTQEPEEQLALAVYRELAAAYPRLRLIVTPRHPERFQEVAELLGRSGLAWQRRSRLDEGGGDPQARVLLVDAVGELGAWWGTARIAFVGGSMGTRGGQNMIEPAAYGAAVSFGPHTSNFRDVVGLMLQRQAAVVVADREQLAAFVRRCLAEPEFADDLGRRARQLVLEQLGAADKTCQILESLMSA